MPSRLESRWREGGLAGAEEAGEDVTGSAIQARCSSAAGSDRAAKTWPAMARGTALVPLPADPGPYVRPTPERALEPAARPRCPGAQPPGRGSGRPRGPGPPSSALRLGQDEPGLRRDPPRGAPLLSRRPRRASSSKPAGGRRADRGGAGADGGAPSVTSNPLDGGDPVGSSICRGCSSRGRPTATWTSPARTSASTPPSACPACGAPARTWWIRAALVDEARSIREGAFVPTLKSGYTSTAR